MSLWSKVWKDEARDWCYAPLLASQVPEFIPERNVQAGSDYLTITLKSMRICDLRRGWSKFYAMAQSYTTIPTLSGRTVEVTAIVSPDSLKKIDEKNVDRVIQVNATLLEEAAYNGGTIGFEIGLFSVKESDLAAPFISLLESVAGHAGVSFLSAVTPFVEPLKKGVESFTGIGEAVSLEIGLSTELNPLQTGWFLVMRAKKGSIDLQKLRVTPNDFRLVDEHNKLVANKYPYLIMTIQASEKKQRWFAIPEISSMYNELSNSVRKADYVAARELLASFRRTLLSCIDLHQEDAVKIYAIVKTRVDLILGGGLTAAVSKSELPPLGSFVLTRK